MTVSTDARPRSGSARGAAPVRRHARRGPRASGLPREDVRVTSKLNNGFHERDAARRAFDGTLAALGTDYVDLFLVHWPLPTRYGGDFVSTWKVLEELHADGRIRSIGVSNFEVDHLERLARECDVVAAVDRIEAHLYFTTTPSAATARSTAS